MIQQDCVIGHEEQKAFAVFYQQFSERKAFEKMILDIG